MLKTCYPLVLFYSHIDPAALEACVSHDVGVANQWYHELNGMQQVNLKIQIMFFFFPVKDTLEIFGMEIDNKLNFFQIIIKYKQKVD